MRRRYTGSERRQLPLFRALPGALRLRDVQDLMAYPFFSLSKSRRTKPILYKAGSVEVQVFATAEHGMATIWDADILIWAASQIVEAQNLGFPTSRFLRFVPYQLLTAIGRATGAREYKLLKASFQRLQSTSIATTIRNEVNWRRHQFSWINEWEELTRRDGRIEGMEFVLPDWFYRGVSDHTLILSIDPVYFQLKGGIERWLYRVARKHAGHQQHGWLFDLPHLHKKSGTLARLSDFAIRIRRIAKRQPLPGYRLQIEREAGQEWLRILPENLSTPPVDNSVDGIGISDAPTIGISNATLSGYRTHEPHVSPWNKRRISTANIESNNIYNFCCSKITVEKPLLAAKTPGTAGRNKP